MSVAAKKLLIKIEISEGKKTKLYLVPKDAAQAVATLLEEIGGRDENSVSAESVFPDLADPSKHPMITFRGIRSKTGLTQKDVAERLGIAQADVSNIERGKRSIGKALAKRIEKEFGIDYRRFL
jgi:DNA-binding XRE family transcriptional regulator